MEISYHRSAKGSNSLNCRLSHAFEYEVWWDLIFSVHTRTLNNTHWKTHHLQPGMGSAQHLPPHAWKWSLPSSTCFEAHVRYSIWFPYYKSCPWKETALEQPPQRKFWGDGSPRLALSFVLVSSKAGAITIRLHLANEQPVEQLCKWLGWFEQVYF